MEKNRVQSDNHSFLLDAVQEAELLLGYISRQGLDFDKKMAMTIVKSKHLFASGSWTPENETEFWEAYNAAARDIAPVTVASIKATMNPPAHGFLFKATRFLSMGNLKTTASRWFAMQYSICALVILITLISVQIYWSSGMIVLGKIEKHKQAFETIRTTFQTVGREGKKQVKEESPEMEKLRAQLRWEKNTYNADLIIFKKYWQPRWLKNDNSQHDALHYQKDREPADFNREELASVGVASLGLQMLQANILPLLYGLLGAAAYVLRTLSLRIKNITYVPTANTGFGLRMQLGALAGLAIGWFYKPDAVVDGSSLSPFALAFLAGYSVELFFTAMDKFVLAFSGVTPKDQKKSTKTKPSSHGSQTETGV